MTRLSSLVLFCYIFHGGVPGLTPDEAIKKAEDGFLNAKTLKSEFKLRIDWKLKDTVEEKSGKIFVQHPDKVRVELGDALFISDGRTFYRYSGRARQMVINRSGDMGGDFTPGEWLFRYSGKYRPVSMEATSLEKENCLCVTLTPREKENRFRQLRVWVAGEACAVRLIETTDRNDNIASYRILRFDRNPRLPASLFAFKPPKGTEIIDMRE